MLKDLIKLANALDSKGLRAEADFLDEIINKWASDQVTEESAQSDLEWREEGTHSGKPYLVARDKKGVKYYINNGGYEVLHIFKDKDEDDIDRIVKLQVTSDLRLSNSLKDSLPGTESMRNKYKELANIQSQEFSKKFEAYKSELSKHGTSYVDLSDWWSDNIQIAPSL